MARPDWDERYQNEDAPWDTGKPDVHLIELVTSGITEGRALEVGCGTGTNCLWLAGQGLDVTGIDVAPTAIEKAKAKASAADASVQLESLNFFDKDALPAGPFDLVFDRGCFHVFDEASERSQFAEHVAHVLSPGGVWLSVIGSTEGGARDHGPPRRSAREITAALEPFVEILRLESKLFSDDIPALAWVCLSRRRVTPAQPSTRR